MDWKEEVPVADAGTAVNPDGGAQCCYFGKSKIVDCPGGRPFLVDGEAQLASLEDAPEEQGAGIAPCDARLPDTLAETWLEAARMEHASVASFARLTLELMAFGAPLRFVEDAQRAALDELRHAELCVAEAHRYTTRRFRFGPLPGAGRANPGAAFTDFLTRNILEGCIGETIAAAVMAEQARAAADPELANALRTVAEDETAHAALAWRILRWALTVSGSDVREVARRVFASAEAAVRAGSSRGSGAEPELSRYGLSSPAEQRRVALRVWEDAIRPLAGELLSEPAVSLDGNTATPTA